MKSVMTHQFSKAPQAEIPRSSFDRSHGIKTTFDAGYLIPILVDEVLPGDTFNVNMTGFARLSTPIFPIMDNMYMDTFFFAVPIRLVWDNWEKFNGAQDNITDSTDFLIPTMLAPAVTGHLPLSLSDYFGIPTDVPDLKHSSLWHRAYNLIFNDWFRDENLKNKLVVDKDDGPDADTDYVKKRRGKRHDYFTSALPWPQKGESIDLPLGTKAPVSGIGVYYLQNSTLTDQVTKDAVDMAANYDDAISTAVTAQFMRFTEAGAGGQPDVYADLSNATAATINQLRQAFQIQKLLERDARGGTRYTEIIRSHFGVTSPDARLQRPEYLGGGTSPVNVTPIAQTSETVITAQGNLAAMGTATLNNHGFSKSFTEHCLIIGLVNVRADLTYQQGLNRMFSRLTRYDFYWPALCCIGEQSVLNKEIFAQGSVDPAADEAVFGYQERYAEYRYKPSQITGNLRSNDPATLDSWHLSQEFASLPTLDFTFIQEVVPLDRCVAVPSEPHFIFDGYFSMRCARPMPLYGVPGLIDHF